MKEGELYQSKYKILKVYKETSEACVLLAEHIWLKSYWIIKKLNSVNNETMQEVEVLKGVKHRGIPVIIDVIAEEDSLVMIREFVEGVNLNEYSKNGLSQAEIIDIGLKICQVVRFLHEELASPLIFRDIKPGNIIMTSTGELKLIDFGIARFYKEDNSHDTTYLGTKGFASPEQYGIRQSDVRTDVFGLGATLYYLATQSDLGKPPYQVLPLSNFRNDIDKALELILIKACEINRNKRYQSIEEIQMALMRLVKVEEQKKWHEKLVDTKLSMLVFFGLKAGAGTTYTAIRLAKYLAAHHIKTSIIDVSENENLLSLEYQDEAIAKKGSVEYKGISIVKATQLNIESTKMIEKRFEDIQVVVVDFGRFSYENYLEFNEGFESCEKLRHFIVSRVSPWEIELFEEFILSDDFPKTFDIIVNGCSKERFDEIHKSLEDIELLYLPFVPFEALNREDKFCHELLRGMEVYEACPKKESFLNPSFYKTKLLKRIKL